MENKWRVGYPDRRCVQHEAGKHPGGKECLYEVQGFLDYDPFDCYVSTTDGARVIVGSDDGGPFLTAEDARLIAAAPDLLAACHQAISVLKHVNFLDGKSVEEKQISDAIAKAEGIK